ncbi:MAG TPA: nuclear transport factor 2 family protein [Candidatus Limnocylindrales bacterium]|nr:nuclear transport factor 2 family protein [Candidatus Limnocylindrales bacterium]
MTDTERFIQYAIAFERAFATDDWSGLDEFFTDDAVHHVKGGGPFAVLSMGRDEVIANLRRSVDTIDRRFDRRLPEVIAGPEERDGAVWITFRATFEREGLPPLVIEGNHATRFRGDRICRIDEGISRAVGERAATYMREYDSELLPARGADCHSAPRRHEDGARSYI